MPGMSQAPSEQNVATTSSVRSGTGTAYPVQRDSAARRLTPSGIENLA